MPDKHSRTDNPRLLCWFDPSPYCKSTLSSMEEHLTHNEKVSRSVLLGSTKVNEMKEGDICPHCKEYKLEFIPEHYPYTLDHLMCPVCNSTYILKED